MALTTGFKKFLGMVATIAVIGGGLVYWKHMPKTSPQVEQTQAVQVQQDPQPVQAQAPEPVAQQDSAPQPTQMDPSQNRGMQNLLKAGSK